MLETMLTSGNYYEMLTVSLYSEREERLYNRIIVYRNSISMETALNILSISMKNMNIVSVKKEKAVCLVNDSKVIKYYNIIDKYWIDGVLKIFSISDGTGNYNYLYIVTEWDKSESNEYGDFNTTLNTGEKLYLEELGECWVLRDQYYKN
ncbi:hypothetical protein EJW97_14110 [Enterococcus faecalis]|nr:hypothetical protein [Enterococcus faecalis]EGS7980795.1 hypothetical protein [Enterococcus faecalis]